MSSRAQRIIWQSLYDPNINGTNDHNRAPASFVLELLEDLDHVYDLIDQVLLVCSSASPTTASDVIDRIAHLLQYEKSLTENEEVSFPVIPPIPLPPMPLSSRAFIDPHENLQWIPEDFMPLFRYCQADHSAIESLYSWSPESNEAYQRFLLPTLYVIEHMAYAMATTTHSSWISAVFMIFMIFHDHIEDGNLDIRTKTLIANDLVKHQTPSKPAAT